MLEEIPVHLRHFSCADQMNGQLEGFDAQLRVEQVKGDLPKQPRINAADALTVQQRASGSCGETAMFLVGRNDALHKRMAHDVALAELDDGNPFHRFERVLRLDEAGFLGVRQIDLRHVAGNHGLAAVAKPGEEHEHLFGGGVLRLIKNDKGVVERAAAHVGEGAISMMPRSRFFTMSSAGIMS